jgi:hypothetical protein
MKAIDTSYSVGMGYWASRNNVQEYKVYVIVIRMFDSVLGTTCNKLLETIHGQLNKKTTTIGPVYYAKHNIYRGRTKQTNVHW